MENERLRQNFALDAISASGNTELIKDVARKMSKDDRIKELDKIRAKMRLNNEDS